MQTIDKDLALSVVFRSGGHIGLTWTGSWSAWVTSRLGAGEHLAAAASGIRHVLQGDPS